MHRGLHRKANGRGEVTEIFRRRHPDGLDHTHLHYSALFEGMPRPSFKGDWEPVQSYTSWGVIRDPFDRFISASWLRNRKDNSQGYREHFLPSRMLRIRKANPHGLLTKLHVHFAPAVDLFGHTFGHPINQLIPFEDFNAVLNRANQISGGGGLNLPKIGYRENVEPRQIFHQWLKDRPVEAESARELYADDCATFGYEWKGP